LAISASPATTITPDDATVPANPAERERHGQPSDMPIDDVAHTSPSR
jgi:hypothetical protein